MKLSDLIAPVYEELFFDNKSKEVIITGGRSSAKGDFAYTKMIVMLLEETCEARVFVPQQGTIRKGCFAQVQKILKRMEVVPKSVLVKDRCIILENGSTVFFDGLAMDNGNKKAEAFKGADSTLGIKMVIFDELASLDDDTRLNDIKETYGRHNPQFLHLWNPPDNKTHWLFDFVDIMGQPEIGAKILHTTVYDLPKRWPNIEGSIRLAEQQRLKNELVWKHKWLGLPTGVSGMAYPLEDFGVVLCEPSLLTDWKIRHYVQFIDNGIYDSTAFLTFAICRKGVILVDTFYYSGREQGPIPQSAQAVKLKEHNSHLLLTYGIDIKHSVCDSAEFAMECVALGLKVANISGKKRDLAYSTSFNLLMSDKFKVLPVQSNLIFMEQLSNAVTETLIQGGIQKTVIKRPKNDRVPEKKQIHALDCYCYMAMTYYRQYVGGETYGEFERLNDRDTGFDFRNHEPSSGAA